MNDKIPHRCSISIANSVELNAVLGLLAELEIVPVDGVQHWVKQSIGSELHVDQAWGVDNTPHYFISGIDPEEYTSLTAEAFMALGTDHKNTTELPSKMVFDIKNKTELYAALAFLSFSGVERSNYGWNIDANPSPKLYAEFNPKYGKWNFWSTVEDADTYSRVELDRITFSGRPKISLPVGVQKSMDRLKSRISRHQAEVMEATRALKELESEHGV